MANLEDARKDLQRAREENAVNLARTKLLAGQTLVNAYPQRHTQPKYAQELRDSLYYAWKAFSTAASIMVEDSEPKRTANNIVESLRVAIAALDERTSDQTSLDLIFPPIADVVDHCLRAAVDCHRQIRSSQAPAPQH
jgi:hypothetical protein